MKRLHLVTFLSLILFLTVFVFAVQRIADTRQNADESDSASVNSENYLTIAGYVYIDENQNGERDLEERSFIAGRVNVAMYRNRPRNTPTTAPTVTISPTPTYAVTTPQPIEETITPPLSFIRTDNQGYFKYTIPSNTVPERNYFIVQLLLPEDFTSTTKNPIIFENLYKRSKKILEFGLVRTKAAITPTLACTNGLVDIETSEECGDNSYRRISYVCQDGYSGTMGETTSCKTYDTWKEYAYSACAERGCNVTPQVCAQVITYARNRTGQCRRFPTACLPEGWKADRSCTITPTISPTPVACATPPVCADGEQLLTGDPIPGTGICPEYYCIGY